MVSLHIVRVGRWGRVLAEIEGDNLLVIDMHCGVSSRYI